MIEVKGVLFANLHNDAILCMYTCKTYLMRENMLYESKKLKFESYNHTRRVKIYGDYLKSHI